MSKSKQLDVGNSTEEIICNYFSQKGYWAFIIPKKAGGQPFDLIACKGNDTWFVDAKHVDIKKASFEFSRIEPNQRTAMERAVGKGKIKNVGFFIFWERTPDKLYFFPFRMWKTLEDSGCKSVKMVDMICIQL